MFRNSSPIRCDYALRSSSSWRQGVVAQRGTRSVRHSSTSAAGLSVDEGFLFRFDHLVSQPSTQSFSHLTIGLQGTGWARSSIRSGRYLQRASVSSDLRRSPSDPVLAARSTIPELMDQVRQYSRRDRRSWLHPSGNRDQLFVMVFVRIHFPSVFFLPSIVRRR